MKKRRAMKFTDDGIYIRARESAQESPGKQPEIYGSDAVNSWETIQSDSSKFEAIEHLGGFDFVYGFDAVNSWETKLAKADTEESTSPSVEELERLRLSIDIDDLIKYKNHRRQANCSIQEDNLGPSQPVQGGDIEAIEQDTGSGNGYTSMVFDQLFDKGFHVGAELCPGLVANSMDQRDEVVPEDSTKLTADQLERLRMSTDIDQLYNSVALTEMEDRQGVVCKHSFSNPCELRFDANSSRLSPAERALVYNSLFKAGHDAALARNLHAARGDRAPVPIKRKRQRADGTLALPELPLLAAEGFFGQLLLARAAEFHRCRRSYHSAMKPKRDDQRPLMTDSQQLCRRRPVASSIRGLTQPPVSRLPVLRRRGRGLEIGSSVVTRATRAGSGPRRGVLEVAWKPRR
ncbi:hypothetical protein THAOC_08438 [Thalassiosira oceanica]|uniref:Uncharacterized protein n=1 Tax=Thalassiosira oceanica TaxID=159749 RepID=K0TI81_THAOC|nr:hypothetical protein THAOC_08438 [Thalassiosira oceanica]|eukprot:EJK70222.1 hypothetical protein THAOC_08438 [Thalassiosira oceanica]